MQQLQLWNVVIQKKVNKSCCLLLNIVSFHCLLNGSVHKSEILPFEV